MYTGAWLLKRQPQIQGDKKGESRRSERRRNNEGEARFGRVMYPFVCQQSRWYTFQQAAAERIEGMTLDGSGCGRMATAGESKD